MLNDANTTINDDNGSHIITNRRFNFIKDENKMNIYKTIVNGVMFTTTVITVSVFFCTITRYILGSPILHTNHNNRPLKSDIVTTSTYQSASTLPFATIFMQNSLIKNLTDRPSSSSSSSRSPNIEEKQDTEEKINKKMKEIIEEIKSDSFEEGLYDFIEEQKGYLSVYEERTKLFVERVVRPSLLIKEAINLLT